MTTFDLRSCSFAEVSDLVARFHGYGRMGNSATYCFAVYESDRIVAAYAWKPPALGSARSVCPECPAAVLSLDRMVAVPKMDRLLIHISKPLRLQMRDRIDRGRWPVLVTYSDESQGHDGNVYKCSGWRKTARSLHRRFTNMKGERVASYPTWKSEQRGLIEWEPVFIQRWEHWLCERGAALAHLESWGWRKVALGRNWRDSGRPAHTWINVELEKMRRKQGEREMMKGR